MGSTLVVLAIAGLLMVVFIASEVQASSRRAWLLISTRDEVTFEEWLNASGLSDISGDARCLVEKVLEIAGECYLIPSTCFRMSDRFNDELIRILI